MASKSINERADPINRPCHHHVEPSPARILEHLIEAWSLIAALRAANAGVVVFGNNLPTAPLRNLPELALLVLDRLLVG